MIKSIAILIPTREAEKELAYKTAEVMEFRAGIPCKAYVLVDKDLTGWQKTINRAVQEIDADYYVYSCADYYPGKDYLKRAYQMLQDKGGSGLVAFNDGKWDGAIATAGLIDKEYLKTLYGGPLLFPEYINHYGDTELTIFAIADEKYYYCSNALLIEVEYKDARHKVNIKDKILFNSRKKKGFDRGISSKVSWRWE